MGIHALMGRKAIFLDRDGVINANVFYADSGEVEAPRTVADFHLLPGALEAMKQMQDAGYFLFVVSNQPNRAKRKATQADHESIHARLIKKLDQVGVGVEAFFYCFHHPNGVEPSLSGLCDCRKPSPFFLNQARDRYNLDMAQSWMVGDRETDIACGHAAGVKTIHIAPSNATTADHTVPTLMTAAPILCA